MFSYGPPTVWNAPHSTDWRCESRNAHRLLAATYAKFAPPEPSRRTSVLPRVASRGRVGDLRRRVRVRGRIALPARSVTRRSRDVPASACGVTGLIGPRLRAARSVAVTQAGARSDLRRVRVRERGLARQIRREARHVGLRVDVRRDGRERDGDVHTVAGGHVQERQADVRALDQVQRAARPDRRCRCSGS